MWRKWIKKKVAILQILQPRQGNLEEGKGKEFPCCTCWRLKHNLGTPAGTTQGVRWGALKCSRCSATPPLSLTHQHSHIHPSKTSISTSTRSLNPQPPASASPPGAAAAPKLWDNPEQRHPGPLPAGPERLRGSGSRSFPEGFGGVCRVRAGWEPQREPRAPLLAGRSLLVRLQLIKI